MFRSLLKECYEEVATMSFSFSNQLAASQYSYYWIVSCFAAAATCILIMLIFVKRQQNGRSGSKQQQQPVKLPPGPFSWPIVGNMLQADDLPHRWFAKLSCKYGPLLYLHIGSLPYVIVNNAEMAKETLKTRDAEFSFRPRSMFAEVISFGYEDMVFRSCDEKWRALRKLCASNMLTPTGLRMWSAVRQEEITSMVSSVHAAAANTGGSVISLKRVISETNLNIIYRILFGNKFFRGELQNVESEEKSFLNLLDRIVLESGQVNLGDFFPALQWLDLQRTEKRLKTDMKRALEKFFYAQLADNRKKQQGCFLSVLQSLEGEESLSEKTIAGIMCDLILAGTDTTSVTVEWAFAELLANPPMLSRAQEELDSVVGRQRLVQEWDLPNLPYLQAIVKETLRLHPPLPLGIPHYNYTTTHLAGYTIPAHSTLLINIAAIGRDPANWSNATLFNPDRFVGSNVQPYNSQQFHLMPFSAGRRHCPGYPLALTQVPHILASLLQGFNWSLPGTQKPEDLSLQEKIGLACYKAEPLEAVPSCRFPSLMYYS